jgi:hypothetical protein
VLAQSASLEISPDTTASFNGTVLRPRDVGRDDLAGAVAFTTTGAFLPVGVNLEGFERLSGANSSLISTDISAALPGGFVVQPGDVVRVSSGVPSVAWSSRAPGVDLEAVGVDAIAEFPDGDLLLSFDTTVAFGGIVAFDEDLVRIDLPAGTPSLVFDGSALGVDPGLDLDAVDLQADGRLLLSFDGGGRVGFVEFRDDDVVVYDPILQRFATTTAAYDGSTRHAAWDAADLDAIDSAGPLIADYDGDGIADLDDVCPFWVQLSNLDTDVDRRGNECECTDQSGDGRNTVADLVAINQAIFGLIPVSPLCDGNNDTICNVIDIVAANQEIFSPTSTSICSRQPFPGP